MFAGVMPQSLPSLILFHKEKPITTHNGVIMEEQLDELLASNIQTVKTKQSDPMHERKPGFVNLGVHADDYMLTDAY